MPLMFGGMGRAIKNSILRRQSQMDGDLIG